MTAATSIIIFWGVHKLMCYISVALHLNFATIYICLLQPVIFLSMPPRRLYACDLTHVPWTPTVIYVCVCVCDQSVGSSFQLKKAPVRLKNSIKISPGRDL